MSKKISLNPKYTNNSGNSWSTTTYNSLEYHISKNKANSSVSTLKCEFTTPYDNIDVVIEIGSSSENNFDWCYVGKLDDSNPSYNSNYLDRVSGYVGPSYAPSFKKVTINVAKAGTHFLIIGYRKDGSGSYGNDCGYFRLVTTEVDSMEPTKYIYCGTKTTVVSEEPIKFTKTNVSYGSDGNKNWVEYQGSNKDYLWEAPTGDDGYKTAKISFTTLSDNTIVTLKYDVFWRFTDENFTVSELDSTNSFVSEDGPCSKIVTKEITVPKAGEHFIIIGYKSNYFNYTHVYVGFFGTNVVKNVKTLLPESIFANNRNIDEVYVGSELIWNKSITLWSTQQYLYDITWGKQPDVGQIVSYKQIAYDKFDNSRKIISVDNNDIKTYYGFNVKDFVKNGYIYFRPYLTTMDMYDIPNPVDMYSRHNYQDGSNLCKYLKINPKLKKETTSLERMFNGFGSNISTDVNTEFPVFNVQPIYEHKACNIVGLDKLNTGNITYMGNMFTGARVVGNLDFSNWDTSKVTNMSYMFWDANGKNRCKYGNKYRLENYSYLTGLNNWNLQSVNDMRYIFNSSTYYDFKDKELVWNTSNVTDMSSMFAYCNAYNFPKLSFDTRNVTNMSYMFRQFESYNDLKLNFTDTSKVTDMSSMFGFCNTENPRQSINEYNFSYLNYHGNADISCLDTSNVVNAKDMFSGCKYITPDMIKNIRLPKATNIRYMFRYAYMGGWDFANNKTAYIDTIDLSSFDLGSITKIDSMVWAFAFGGARIWNNDDEGIGTYIGNLILDNWKCFQSYTNHDFILSKNIAPFNGCHVTYCYMRGCNDNTKIVLKKMLGLNSTYAGASCKYFIED